MWKKKDVVLKKQFVLTIVVKLHFITVNGLDQKNVLNFHIHVNLKCTKLIKEHNVANLIKFVLVKNVKEKLFGADGKEYLTELKFIKNV